MNTVPSSTLPQRKGARRREDIPAEVLRGLNEGWLATVNLTEWLAIDMALLLRHVLRQLDHPDLEPILGSVADSLASAGVMQRIEGIGTALHTAFQAHPDRSVMVEALATHPADTVRQWANYMIVADPNLSLAERLSVTRRFAADEHFGVRECAWMSVRPFINADLEQGLALLRPWVRDPDPNIRRFAVEGTRPRGVWCAHISALKQNPDLGLSLLEPVRADPSRYVQLSVANWLNDASKSRPDWVRALCDRWHVESTTKETAWIVNHALRTLRKG
ncbi:MAG: DNA alkylation repair protein [Chloroflexales bacterium]|nr:DNA alkylation repair protein [Chloroflexales bacterium]